MFIIALFIIVKICKQPKCPLNWWLQKQNWYIHTVEYYSDMKEMKIDVCYNMYKHQKHFANSETPITKGHQLYDFIYESIRTKAGLVVFKACMVERAFGERKSGRSSTRFIVWENSTRVCFIQTPVSNFGEGGLSKNHPHFRAAGYKFGHSYYHLQVWWFVKWITESGYTSLMVIVEL